MQEIKKKHGDWRTNETQMKKWKEDKEWKWKAEHDKWGGYNKIKQEMNKPKELSIVVFSF